MNQRGQVTVEAILIIVMMVTLFAFVQKSLFRDREFLSEFIQGPWSVVAGLIENGVPGTPDSGRNLHPGHFERHLTMKGEDP